VSYSIFLLSLAAFALITTLLLLARGGSDYDEEYIEEDVTTFDAVEPGDETLPAPA
jgi:hypothetical protein